MLLSDFDYELPEALIAQTPLEPRNTSRLMVIRRDVKDILHRKFYDLQDFLKSGDTLIFNDTKVMPARLIGVREKTGAKIEVLLLTRRSRDNFEVLVKPGKKVKIGDKIIFSDSLACEIINVTDFGGRVIKFFYQGVFEEILDTLGEMPLPPYIHQKLLDKDRYQTVYAKAEGSAAAPTAGLHFTKEQLQELKARGINLGFLTLHVGLGTFRPVKTDTIEDHTMHSEYYSLSQEVADLINKTKAQNKRVIAVGTTSIRTLEAVYKKHGKIKEDSGFTDIFIYPGYEFKVVDAVITNFHLPKSTLIMLISAFLGREKTLFSYRLAVKKKYRFFSFGDAMLIL